MADDELIRALNFLGNPTAIKMTGAEGPVSTGITMPAPLTSVGSPAATAAAPAGPVSPGPGTTAPIPGTGGAASPAPAVGPAVGGDLGFLDVLRFIPKAADLFKQMFAGQNVGNVSGPALTQLLQDRPDLIEAILSGKSTPFDLQSTIDPNTWTSLFTGQEGPTPVEMAVGNNLFDTPAATMTGPVAEAAPSVLGEAGGFGGGFAQWLGYLGAALGGMLGGGQTDPIAMTSTLFSGPWGPFIYGLGQLAGDVFGFNEPTHHMREMMDAGKHVQNLPPFVQAVMRSGSMEDLAQALSNTYLTGHYPGTTGQTGTYFGAPGLASRDASSWLTLLNQNNPMALDLVAGISDPHKWEIERPLNDMVNRQMALILGAKAGYPGAAEALQSQIAQLGQREQAYLDYATGTLGMSRLEALSDPYYQSIMLQPDAAGMIRGAHDAAIANEAARYSMDWGAGSA